jgi:RHH-type proline utilization regulon transcriptional repressor/proline dehydrogenase/delta 1-pyrroline-5-carboxylate dehydrogenase
MAHPLEHGGHDLETASSEFGLAALAVPPFSSFEGPMVGGGALRRKITAACRISEEDALRPLLALAELAPDAEIRARAHARRLIEWQRTRKSEGGFKALMREYALSSQEGVALMCLAEALLRIPDSATRDALIRDKLSGADWRAHLGHNESIFVNATTWALLISERIVAPLDGGSLATAVARLADRGGRPLIQKGIAVAMRLLGAQFVMGRNIGEALKNTKHAEKIGFRFSFDMLGEAAMTAEDAQKYHDEYERAIDAIGREVDGKGLYEGAGISIKLSALHPRYGRANLDRILLELFPRVLGLVRLARRYNIGVNIDAEESERLEVSLEILERVCASPDLADWNGVGFVVQAYQKRAPAVVDYLIDLGRRTGRRLMVRLVKGAYWDSEIKRAQLDGLDGYPVYTRKAHTDVSYLACARKLLAAPAEIFPQFATHNAQTLAWVQAMAGREFVPGQYEFQCLHGMGEVLYSGSIGEYGSNRPCRIYAPVGSHETLLAYLVRRLLENGANSSFVNQVTNPDIGIETLLENPVTAATRCGCRPHPLIRLPRDIYSGRLNSRGFDFSNDDELTSLALDLRNACARSYLARPMPYLESDSLPCDPARNPADSRDTVGRTLFASTACVDRVVARAIAATNGWGKQSAASRAAILRRAAELLESRMPEFVSLLVREAGKSVPNAVAEVRESVDFLRYYALEIVSFGPEYRPLGVVACISPWNFPLAIFLGQVSAALAAGNTVIAKPAEETSLVASLAVALLWEAGVPVHVLQMLPGAGEVGGALTFDERINGVIFTGSSEVACLIAKALASRLSPDGAAVPLIAETGGINAMIVDSSALAEQVVADVIMSAFDSAGQRCSALRLLCLQEDTAAAILKMLKGAMNELSTGNPDRLSVDVGPIISSSAQSAIVDYIEDMRAHGFPVHQGPLGDDAKAGFFVTPTLIEVTKVSDLSREVFGPVLHVVRYGRGDLDRLIDSINSLGYGLTFGVHSRIDAVVNHALRKIEAGNIYVNRNMIGATVGVQPFGGSGLSGTGPKAGGPLYLRRLLSARREPAASLSLPCDPRLAIYVAWLRDHGYAELAQHCWTLASNDQRSPAEILEGPVGEQNLYHIQPRGVIRCVAATMAGLLMQLGAVVATGNQAIFECPGAFLVQLDGLPTEVRAAIVVDDVEHRAKATLFDGSAQALLALQEQEAGKFGPIASIHRFPDLASWPAACDCLDWLVKEQSISINTAASGGNIALMTLGTT